MGAASPASPTFFTPLPQHGQYHFYAGATFNRSAFTCWKVFTSSPHGLSLQISTGGPSIVRIYFFGTRNIPSGKIFLSGGDEDEALYTSRASLSHHIPRKLRSSLCLSRFRLSRACCTTFRRRRENGRTKQVEIEERANIDSSHEMGSDRFLHETKRVENRKAT